jgi:hypothetical protein
MSQYNAANKAGALHSPVPMRKPVTVTGLLATINFREFLFHELG